METERDKNHHVDHEKLARVVSVFLAENESVKLQVVDEAFE